MAHLLVDHYAIDHSIFLIVVLCPEFAARVQWQFARIKPEAKVLAGVATTC